MMLVAEVTEWCASIMVTFKWHRSHKNVCGFIQAKLLRERYQSPTPLEAVADIAAEETRYFTIMDAVQPYHQIPLDVGSHTLTIFITTFSHFRYLTAPYSLSSIADLSNYQISKVFERLLGFRRVIDVSF